MAGHSAYPPPETRDVASASPPADLLAGPGASCWFTWHGQRIHYRSAGSGPVLVLLHGPEVGSGGFVWRHVDTWLSEQYHVIIPDLPGYGLSDIYRGSYTADVYLRFVESFLERACGPMSRVCACGLSSSAVLRIAARRPHLISKLALVSPVSTAHGRQNPLHSVAAPLFGASGLTAASVQRNLSASAILQTVSANLYAPGSPLAEEAVPLRHWVANRPFASYVEASRLSGLMNADIRQPLRAAHQPLLVLTGAYAPKPVLDEAESVAQLAANGSYFAFRESSASPHEEEPESFCRTLTGFFESDAFAHVA